jgi:hypothetical protein
MIRLKQTVNLRLKVKGKVHTEFVREGKVFEFSGLVVEELDCAIFVAMPFLSRNDISVRGAKNQIICHRDGITILL